MMIIGVDYHPSFQAIAFCVEETGECGEQELNHSDGQAEKFYRDLKQRGMCVRVRSSTGHAYSIGKTKPRLHLLHAFLQYEGRRTRRARNPARGRRLYHWLDR